MTRNRQVLAIVFTRAEDRRRGRRGCGPSQPLAVSARHARAERERERKRKEGNRGWSLSNEDGKSRAVRLFNIQGWSVAAARCVSRCHCYTPGSLSAMTISRVLFSESERAGERASNPLSCHPSFQFPSRVILCPSTLPCPSAKIALFSGNCLPRELLDYFVCTWGKYTNNYVRRRLSSPSKLHRVFSQTIVGKMASLVTLIL